MDEDRSENAPILSPRPRVTGTGYERLESEWELRDHPRPISEDRVQRTQKTEQTSADRIEEKKHRRHWLPWLCLAFAFNFFFWVSMIFATFEIGEYHGHRRGYLATAWLIFLAPSAFTVALLLSPVPTTLKQWRNEWSDRELSRKYFPIVNIFNALACLVMVVIYLYVSAIPEYNRPKWATSIEYQPYLSIPSFAFVFWDEGGQNDQKNDVQPADTSQLKGDPLYVYNYNVTTGTPIVYTHDDAMEWMKIGPYNTNAFVFNSSKLPAANSTIVNLQSQIILTTYVNYNLTEAVGPANQSFSPLSMSLGGIFFDPHMSLDTVYSCGFAGFPTFQAFATNYVSLTASYTTDIFGLMRPGGSSGIGSNSPACRSASQDLLAMTEPPYTSWSFTLDGAMPYSDLDSCDVVKNGKEALCAMQVVMSYSTQMVQKLESSSGLSKLEIWLNAGAIVGGVQFFVWFLGIFGQV